MSSELDDAAESIRAFMRTGHHVIRMAGEEDCDIYFVSRELKPVFNAILRELGFESTVRKDQVN